MSDAKREPTSHPPDQPPPGRATDPRATPDGSVADDDVLAALADEFAARLRRGERPAVEDYVAKHPALGD